MTFTELQTELKNRLNLTSNADTRLGLAINRHYKQVSVKLGMYSRPAVGVSANTTNGAATVTFTNLERVDRVRNENVTPHKVLDCVSLDEIRSETPETSDTPTKYAIEETLPTSVTIRLNVLADGVFALKADGIETVSTLSGANVPNFSESFHDIILYRVLAEEYDRKEKIEYAMRYDAKAKELLADLQFYLADSPSQITQQGRRG